MAKFRKGDIVKLKDDYIDAWPELKGKTGKVVGISMYDEVAIDFGEYISDEMYGYNDGWDRKIVEEGHGRAFSAHYLELVYKGEVNKGINPFEQYLNNDDK